MSTPSAGNQVVVTPIFWENAGSGYTFSTAYKNLITTYLADVAADSDTTTNVFSTMFQYSGSNGAINYRMTLGPAIIDTTAYPAAGCTVNGGAVYADSTGYSTCLDDAQVSAETAAVQAGHSLARGLGQLYLMFLPQHVETCFEAGTSPTQACSINSSPSSAFCGYHSSLGTPGQGLYYANMPYPVYSSPTNFSCTTESLGGGIQAPNGNADGDVELSPLSHEMAEAITDPEGDAWSDAKGYENGDDCAYVYGRLGGAAGAHFNQTINGHHYLTQEEFSNADWLPVANPAHEPCLQSIAPVIPTVTGVTPANGPIAGGTSVTITGTGLTGAVAVVFGTLPVSASVIDATHVTAVAPAHAAGSLDISVITPGRVSGAVNGDRFDYVAAPTVTSVSPAAGVAGPSVTIAGTGLTTTSTVAFGGVPATFLIVDATRVSATVPPHAGGAVDITVTTAGGTSATGVADRFTYLVVPSVVSVSPANGPLAGGSTVTITGTELASASSVTFGGVTATFVVADPTHLSATVPAHAAGAVDVVVTGSGGPSPVVAGDQFTYLALPTVTRIGPTAGPVTGGTNITITGSGFLAGASVSVGGKAATSVVVVSPTRITARTPAHVAGLVEVRVSSIGGVSASVATDRFRYLPRPLLTRLTPTSGTRLGGRSVTLVGTGFVVGAVVRFGTTAAHIVSLRATRIVVLAPRHAAGRVAVSVTTPGGRSAAHLTARFLYR
jgi:hypothetical protein